MKRQNTLKCTHLDIRNRDGTIILKLWRCGMASASSVRCATTHFWFQRYKKLQATSHWFINTPNASNEISRSASELFFPTYL